MYNQNWTLEWVSNRNRSEKSSRNVIIKAFSYSVKGLPQEMLWSQSYQIRVTVGICDASGIWSRIDAFHFELPFASILFERSEFWILFIAAEGISCQILLSTEIRHNKMWTAQLRQMDVNQRCTCITLYPPPISKWCITFTGIIDNQSISMKPFHSFIINKNPRLVWHEVATHNHTHKRNQYSFPHRTFHALFQFDAWLLLMICPSLNCGSYFSLYISLVPNETLVPNRLIHASIRWLATCVSILEQMFDQKNWKPYFDGENAVYILTKMSVHRRIYCS